MSLPPLDSLRRWQLRTAAGLLVGYSACYVCRTDPAVTAPLLREFRNRGLDEKTLLLACVGLVPVLLRMSPPPVVRCPWYSFRRGYSGGGLLVSGRRDGPGRGRQGAATAAGLLDTVGYGGGTLALWAIGALAQHLGWSSAFGALALLAAATAGVALVFYRTQERRGGKIALAGSGAAWLPRLG